MFHALQLILSLVFFTYVNGNGCAIFDSAGNLFVFGPNGVQFVGPNPSQWSSTQPQEASGSTDFSSSNVVCLSSHYLNAGLFLNANSQDPSTLHKYSFDSRTWSQISTTGLVPNGNTVRAVIDYDTLVIYAFSDGKLVRLGDANEQNLSKNPSSLEWVDANHNVMPFDASAYQPTFAHAFFNLYFFGVPGAGAGQVWGYRIHYNEWGPGPQSVGATFPSTHGQTATFSYKDPAENEHDGAPSHVAFIPDDYSGVWVIDSYTNRTTSVAAAPSAGTTTLTRYSASENLLVQFTPETGRIRYIDLSDVLVNHMDSSSASWVDVGIVR